MNFSFLIGGTENLLVDILNHQSLSHEVSLIIINNSYEGGMLTKVSERVNIILINRCPGDRRSIGCIFKLWYVLYNMKPDIIHCHTTKLIKILFPFRYKCLYTHHNTHLPLENVRKYKGVFAISKSVQLDLKNRGNIDSILVYNGINFKQISRNNKESFGSVYKIVQVGRLAYKQKGQDLLIKAIAKLVFYYNFNNIRVYFIGEGKSLDYLKTLVIKNCLKDYIVFVGKKDRNWIYKNLCNYNLLVQPSYYEGFGLTVVEGVAAGLPVLASDVDGISEILHNLPSVKLFKPKDVHELTLQLKDAIISYNDREILQPKCDLSYKKLKNKFSIVSTSETYLKYYKLFKYEKKHLL